MAARPSPRTCEQYSSDPVSKIDLYGDSYGSYAAQVFALHYPRFVRDLVLDGTYDQRFDPLEPEAVAALRRAWDTMCRSFPGCNHDDLLHDIASFDLRLPPAIRSSAWPIPVPHAASLRPHGGRLCPAGGGRDLQLHVLS